MLLCHGRPVPSRMLTRKSPPLSLNIELCPQTITFVPTTIADMAVRLPAQAAVQHSVPAVQDVAAAVQQSASQLRSSPQSQLSSSPSQLRSLPQSQLSSSPSPSKESNAASQGAPAASQHTAASQSIATDNTPSDIRLAFEALCILVFVFPSLLYPVIVGISRLKRNAHDVSMTCTPTSTLYT